MFKIKINTFEQALGWLLLSIAFVFASTVFYLWLWKMIAVGVFNLPMLSFWQFLGLRWLLKSLFTGQQQELFKIISDEDENKGENENGENQCLEQN